MGRAGPSCSLTREQLLEYRRQLRAGTVLVKHIAQRHNLSRSYVSRLLLGRTGPLARTKPRKRWPFARTSR